MYSLYDAWYEIIKSNSQNRIHIFNHAYLWRTSEDGCNFLGFWRSPKTSPIKHLYIISPWGKSCARAWCNFFSLTKYSKSVRAESNYHLMEQIIPGSFVSIVIHVSALPGTFVSIVIHALALPVPSYPLLFMPALPVPSYPLLFIPGTTGYLCIHCYSCPVLSGSLPVLCITHQYRFPWGLVGTL